MGSAVTRVRYIYEGKKYPQRFFKEDENIPGQGELATKLFHELKLDKEHIDLFYSVFKKIDRDNSNAIDLEEFYRFFKLEPSPFADKVFSLMDEDSSGEIDFSEFVLCIWNYCTFELKALVKFAFGLFDIDGSGSLEKDEVEELIAQVYGDAWNSNMRVQKVVDLIDINGDGVVSFEEFQDFNRKYPCLLFPAFKMQMALRENIYGARWWKTLTIERATKNFRSQNIYELLDKMTADAYEEKLKLLMSDIQASAAMKQADF